jgi:ubiquinone/menaquinone biosynthesis C-methylase UbiE
MGFTLIGDCNTIASDIALIKNSKMTLPISKIDKKEYILGRTQSEYQRLNVQSKVWENTTSRMLIEAGLQRGMHCLDVASGTGAVSELIGKVVGKTGSVRGFDLDEDLGNYSLNILNSKGASNYFFESGNIDEIEKFKGAPFDFIYCRFLLIHLTNPIAAIKKMYKALKPGGTLLLQDYDFSTLHFSDDTLQIDQYFRELLMNAFTIMNKDPRIGIRLVELIERATEKKANGQESSGIITSARDAISMMKSAFDNMLPVLKKMELVNDEEIRWFDMEADRIAAETTYATAFWPVLGSAWIRKMIDPAYFKENIIHDRFL